MENADLKPVVEHIKGMPSLPQAAHRVMELVNDHESTVPQMVEALLMDQGLTAKILRVANSAYYGFVRKIETVTQAVAVLGKNDIGDQVMSASLQGFFKPKVGGRFDRVAFWEHCFAVAQCTRIVIRLSAHPAEKVYIAALLRDMGRLVIGDVYPDQNDQALALAEEKGWPIQKAEKEVLGFDHTLLGGMLAQHWNFTPTLVDFVSSHHQRVEDLPTGDPTVQMRTVIDLCDLIVRGQGIGQSGDFSPTEIPSERWFPLGLNDSHHDKVVKALDLALNKINSPART